MSTSLDLNLKEYGFTDASLTIAATNELQIDPRAGAAGRPAYEEIEARHGWDGVVLVPDGMELPWRMAGRGVTPTLHPARARRDGGGGARAPATRRCTARRRRAVDSGTRTRVEC